MSHKLVRSCIRISRLIVLSGFINPVFAHHPILAKFDGNQPLDLQGQVTAVDWSSPHAHIYFNVAQNGTAPVNWAVELADPTELEWSGWSSDTVHTGDTIRVTGPGARNGSHQVWGEIVSGAGNEVLFAVPDDLMARRLANRPAGATPLWPDGQPRLGPPPGQTGYWTAPGKHSLLEDGVAVAMDEHGMLANLSDSSKVAPFQDWAHDLYVLRQQNHGADDPLFLYCIPPGGPRQFQVPFGVQFIEERSRNRIFMLMSGGNGNWRLIYTDGREEVTQVSGNDDNPLFYGRSSALWEGNTLVVNTTGFNEGFWFSNGGLPHTRLLSLTEKFTRQDLNTLHYEVTVNDPGAYTRPWTSSWDLQWMPGEELPESYCQDNRQ
jgi:hypothetical protein